MRTAAPLSRLPETLGLALRAGLVLGGAFGLVDGCVAALRTPAALSPADLAGCLAAAVFEYAALAAGVLLVFATVFHPALSRWSARARLQACLALGLTAGVFAELYWWTRPFVFYGWSSLSWQRLAATAGFLVVAVLVARAAARPLAALLERLGWRAAALPAALFAAGGAVIALQPDPLAEEGLVDERTRTLPNVLLVVVDALRADTLGCYGHPRVRSPHVDRLAREGVLFENAFVQAPFTWTSFGSLLTGKHPRRHGLVAMASGVRMVENVTLASHYESARRREGGVLADADVLSATFHTGTLSTGSGLLQGFDVYYEQMAGHGLVAADSAWSVFRADLLLRVLLAKAAQKAGGDVAGTAREWIGAHAQRRFLAMVHLYSTHTPYDPPREYREMYCDPDYAGPLASFYAYHREAIEDGRYAPTPADIEQVRNLYYAGVTQADAAIGAILAELEQAGTLDDTLVIVTADHGESLGESGLWEHNHMVDTNLRVPLVMRYPRGLPAGRRVSALVDQIDVFPTVCDLAGLELPPAEDVYARIDGHSLVPLVRGEVPSVRAHNYAENELYVAIREPGWKLLVPHALVEGDAWLSGADAGGLIPVLFDLAQDPGETRNVLGANVDVACRRRATPTRCDAWSSSATRAAASAWAAPSCPATAERPGASAAARHGGRHRARAGGQHALSVAARASSAGRRSLRGVPARGRAHDARRGRAPRATRRAGRRRSVRLVRDPASGSARAGPRAVRGLDRARPARPAVRAGARAGTHVLARRHAPGPVPAPARAGPLARGRVRARSRAPRLRAHVPRGPPRARRTAAARLAPGGGARRARRGGDLGGRARRPPGAGDRRRRDHGRARRVRAAALRAAPDARRGAPRAGPPA
jgi:arylsulfatase A-like enzyme